MIDLYKFVGEQPVLVVAHRWIYEHYGATSCKVKQHFRGAEIEVWWLSSKPISHPTFYQYIFEVDLLSVIEVMTQGVTETEPRPIRTYTVLGN